jgi:spermidine synthase
MSRYDFKEHDPFAPIVYTYPNTALLHRETSKYQDIQIRQHPYFGRMLILDDVVQLTERDEFFYHEMLVHPVLHTHPDPKHVLIIGGGDGASMREVLRHMGVESVTLAEIDERVVAVSREYFPTLRSGFEDPRAEVVFTDGIKHVQNPPRKYDAIIVDSTDPIGPAENLFSGDFYKAAAEALTENGLFVTQSESLMFHAEFVTEVHNRLKAAFPIADCYAQAIATYAGNWWTFSVGSKQLNPRTPQRRPRMATRLYSAEVHRKAFLAKSIMKKLAAGTIDW